MPWVFRFIGARRLILLGIALAGLWAVLELDLRPGDLVPAKGGLTLTAKFFTGAISPALTYEAEFVPEGTRPLWCTVGIAATRTVGFAAAAASLSLVCGLTLGFFASTAWWADDAVGGAGPVRRSLRWSVRPAIYGVTRIAIALARSIHELVWAVLFLSAMGLTNLAAVVAIAIPFSGSLAKVFAEMIEEAPRDTAVALRAGGAAPLKVFLFGLLPRTAPDLASYALYRFECALRASTILGFFGIPTLGYYIALSFANAHYREVWTFLYALFALVVVVEIWSGALRRRMVS